MCASSRGSALLALTSVLLSTTAALSAPAVNGPFDLVAVYSDKTVRIDAGDLVVQDASEGLLTALRIRFADDAISRTQLAALSKLTAVLTTTPCDGADARTEKALVPKREGEQTLFEKPKIGCGGAKLEIIVEFNNSYLCSMEQKLREPWEDTTWQDLLPKLAPTAVAKIPEPNKPTPAANKRATGVKPDAAPDHADFDNTSIQTLAALTRGLAPKGQDQILYSYCFDAEKAIDWANVACPKLTSPQTGQKDTQGNQECTMEARAAARAKQKGALDRLLRAELQPAVATMGEIGEGLGVTKAVSFRALTKDPCTYRFAEMTFSEKAPLELNHVVDQDSAILLLGDTRGFDRALFDSGFLSVRLSYEDPPGTKQTKLVAVKPDSGGYRLDVGLRPLLQKTIALEVLYRHDDAEIELARVTAIHVENIGVVVSAPGISELVALVERGTPGELSPKDQEGTSSIPVSWAYNMSASTASERFAAVTYPIQFGLNLREEPRLSERFRVFTHVSAILPVDASNASTEGGEPAGRTGKPDLAVGFGVSFLSAFHLSWGHALDGGGEFLFLGLSPQDISRVGDRVDPHY
jgi:hypothetical protein